MSEVDRKTHAHGSDHVESVLNSLCRSAFLKKVWPEGRNPSRAPTDGDHLQLASADRPVSVSRAERWLLFELAKSCAGDVVEIGTGFGVSTICLAAGLEASECVGSVITIDAHTEGGSREDLAPAAISLAALAGHSHRISFLEGSSPEDIQSLLTSISTVALCFIDGDHHGGGPVNDYRALRPYLDANSVVIFHDYDLERYNVHMAVAEALSDGLAGFVAPTSCSMAICTKNMEHLGHAMSLLPTNNGILAWPR